MRSGLNERSYSVNKCHWGEKMNKNNDTKVVIILEGPDNVGKSSLAKELSSLFRAKLVAQPSEKNSVGFLRSTLKQSKMKVNLFERQLAHTVTHVVDLLEEVEGEVVILDRSPISASVYSRVMGLKGKKLKLIEDLNYAVYNNYFKKNNIHVVTVFVDNKKPFKEEDDVAYKGLSFENLRSTYVEVLKDLIHDGGSKFGNTVMFTNKRGSVKKSAKLLAEAVTKNLDNNDVYLSFIAE